jgi:hypothetical protein
LMLANPPVAIDNAALIVTRQLLLLHVDGLLQHLIGGGHDFRVG